MNLEENSAVNNCQEKFLKDSVSNRHSEEFLSPRRRSSRIKKTKIPVDNRNTDQAIGPTNVNIKGTELLIESSDEAVDAITNKKHELYSDNNKGTELTNSNQILEKNCTFFQINNDEDETFNSLFDDIFRQRYPNTLQTLLPKKIEKDSLKEKKFLKKKSLETPNQFISNGYISDKNNLPAEDVSKVFKIISKPNILCDKPTESKACSKSLKTYSNRRKSFQQTDVVESFGLPDCPIASENNIKPTTNNKLDAEILDISEITILDLQYVDEPWIITNVEGESLFPYYEEVRIKAEPDRFRLNGSFLDIIDTEDLETWDFNFFTSTPLHKEKIVNNGVNTSISNTPKNSKTAVKNKVIDIEAIKINFKKMLSKEPEKKSKGIHSRKKKNVAPHSRNTRNSEMLFVKNDSITLADKEIEISNSLPIHEKTEGNTLDSFVNDINDISKKKSSNRNKKPRKTTNVSTAPLRNKTSNKKKGKSSVKDLVAPKNTSAINKKGFRRKGSRKDKKSLEHSNCINKLCPETSNTKVRKRKTPKKKQIETDLVTTSSKSITRSLNYDAHSEKRSSVTISNKKQQNLVLDKLFYLNDSYKTNLKQSSDSSWNLEYLNNVDGAKISHLDVPNEKNTNTFMQNETSNHDSSNAEFLLQCLIKNQTDKLEALKTNMKSNAKTASQSNLTKTTKQFKTKLINDKLKNSVTSGRMLLRSASQENISDIQQVVSPVKRNSINITECYKTEHCGQENKIIKCASSDSDILNNVKINLENCNFKTNLSNLQSVNSKKTVRIPKAIKKTTGRLKSRSKRNAPKELANVRKNKRKFRNKKAFIPELRVVISPLDLSQLTYKKPGIFNDTINKSNISPTKRRLRSSKAVTPITKEDQCAQHNLVTENCNKSNTFKDSQVTDVPALNTSMSEVDSNYLCTKKADSIDSIQLELYKDGLKDNEEFLSAPENDSVFSQNDSCTKNVFVDIEITHEKLATDVTKIKTNIDNCNTVVVPKKEEIYKNTISEKVEKKSLVDLKLSKVHKIDEQSKVDEKPESINTQNHDEFLQDEGRKLAPHAINQNQVEPYGIQKTIIEKKIDETDIVNDNIPNNVFCKESKLHLSSDHLETTEQNEIVVYSNKKETELLSINNISKDISSKLETTIETSETEPKTCIEDVSALQNKSSEKLECNILESDVTDIIKEINESIEHQHSDPSRNDNLSKIDDICTNIYVVEIKGDIHIENKLTNIDHITICESTEITGENSIRNPEENLESPENIQDHIILNDLKQKEKSNIGDKESSATSDSISSCQEELVTDNKLAELTNVDEVSLTTGDNIAEENKSSNNDELIRNIEEDLASENIEDDTILGDLKQGGNQPKLLDEESAVVEESAVKINSISPCQQELIEDNQFVQELTNVDEVSPTTTVPNNITKEETSRKSVDDELIRNTEVILVPPEPIQDNTVLSDLTQGEHCPNLLDDNESTVVEESVLTSSSQELTKDDQSLEEFMNFNEVSLTTVPNIDEEIQLGNIGVNLASEIIGDDTVLPDLILDKDSTVVEESFINIDLISHEELVENDQSLELNVDEVSLTTVVPNNIDDTESTVVEYSVQIDLISCHQELIKDNQSLEELTTVDEGTLTTVPNNIVKEKKSRKSSDKQVIRNFEVYLTSPEDIEDNAILTRLKRRKKIPNLLADKESTVIEKNVSSCHKESRKDNQFLKESNVDEVSLTTGQSNNIAKEKKSRKPCNKLIENTEVNLLSSENIEDNTILSNLIQRENEPKLLVDEESTVIDEISCPKEATEDNLLNVNELSPTAVPNNVAKEKKTRKSSNDKLNNNLSKKKNSESVEAGSVTRRGRSSRRKSVDQGDASDKEKEDYRNKLRRCKSVAPCSRNYIRRNINETDAYSTTNNVYEAEKDDGKHKSNLRRCKSYSQINLHSSNKNDQETNIDHGVKKNELCLVYKRKSNGRNSKKKCDKSMGELNIRTIKSDEYLDFQVGDLVWGQIGCHPYWPCLITAEPETASHKKLVGKRQRIFYHVHFFGDNGRRAWISKHQIILYCNGDDLLFLRKEMKAPMLRYLYIRTGTFQRWQAAVNEAERIKSKSLSEKLAFFHITFNPIPSTKIIPVTNDDTTTEKPEKEPKREPKREPLKRKRKEKIVDPEEMEVLKPVDDDSPVRKKFKKRLSDDEINIVKTDVTTTDVLKHDNDDEPIQNSNVSCSRLRVKLQADDISEIDSKTSSDNTSASLYSMESQKALFKRNNLFKGVSRDKVCQFCLKSGDVLKCRGRCNGSYHIDCATEILKEICYIEKPRKKGRKSKTKIEQNDNDSSFSETASKSDVCENKVEIKLPKTFSCDYNLRYSTRDKYREVKEIFNAHVKKDVSVEKEVISVEKEAISADTVDTVDKAKLEPEKDDPQLTSAPSSVCNTPSRTTLVPDLKNIDLEPIDYKIEDLRQTIINKTKDVEDILNKDIAGADKTVLEPTKGHVQIITVPSSVYNTPPRKTFPPDFKNMTLAEQIDYKMKEIMKKFESKTVYAESSIESRSEGSANRAKHFSRCGALFPVNTGINRIINKDKVTEGAIQEPVVTKSGNSDNAANILSLAETPGLNNSGKSTKTLELAQKSFVRHVTADFDAESIEDDIQEDTLNTSETSVEVSTTIIDPKNFKCGFCISNLDPFCFICNQSVSKRGSSIRQKCSLYQCGRFYHPECLKLWPQTQWSLIQTTKHKGSDQAVDSFVCPLHVCHTCASDDPRAATSRCSGDKIVKCLRCPSTYHSTNLCVPAGSSILSSTQIICPRKHHDIDKSTTINTTWCFLCSEGGNLICCETCPTSVHPECLPVNLTDDDKFICEDCESGRLPLYDEIVWVKLGSFRWWPALILFPNEVPINILNIKHADGEFVVKFFGTYDYYWVNRGRSFLFQEGDTGQCNSVKRKVDAAFNTAVEEAVIAHKLKKEFKLSQEAESITSLKPPPYIRIKVNKPVGNVRQLDLDLSSTTACECDPSQPHPCGPDSDCLNRLLLTECSPDVCPAGKRCKNQSFENREYPPLVPYKTQGRGWGLKTLAPIKKGQFVIEYVGELIDVEEYQRRIQKMHQKKEENYYFLTIDKDRMLDAGPKGNAARFMNHCCQPNCETQKWTVSGDTRVGLFATVDIPADTELTFNYNLECVGKEKKVCRCGASNCSGFIGVKAKQDTDIKKPRRPTFKKKVPTQPIILPPCFICGKKGAVGACNNKVCNKTYHLRCLQMKEWPEGNKFICPWHNCNICSKRTIRCCVKCISSFCPPHSEGNIRYDNLQGFVCSTHDPAKMPNNEGPMKLRKKKTLVVTDETAVTSTTSDDIEDEDDIPLFLRYVKYRKGKKEFTFDSESESECYVSKSAVAVRQKRRRLSSGSRDEGAVSSATMTDVEDDVDAGKRVLRQRRGPRKKKHRLGSIENRNNTAICSLQDNGIREDCSFELSSRCNELEDR